MCKLPKGGNLYAWSSGFVFCEVDLQNKRILYYEKAQENKAKNIETKLPIKTSGEW